jgi:UDP-glucose 4-epimerase
MPKYIIIGGLGYIGSVTAARLLQQGKTVLIYGRPTLLASFRLAQLNKIAPKNFLYIGGDLSDTDELLRNINPDDVIIYLANKRGIKESFHNPLDFWSNNVSSFINFIQKLISTGCFKIVYGSSCAAASPQSPFAYTKSTSEIILQNLALAEVHSIILRYFNVRGTFMDYKLFDKIDKTNDVFIKIFFSLINKTKFELYSEDLDPSTTPPILRDYVHVLDVADANIAAADILLQHKAIAETCDIGTGIGSSVRDLINCLPESLHQIFYTDIGNYSGPQSHMVADPTKAFALLHWHPKYHLQKIVRDSYEGFLYQIASLSPNFDPLHSSLPLSFSHHPFGYSSSSQIHPHPSSQSLKA